MSIDEAKNYRWYWQRGWDANRNGKLDAGAPA
jgi:endo-alpha-1,4-polygalactosaminidase (GH114 family)